MAGRTRKKTRHNEGRKPFYKEHRRWLIPAEAPTVEQAAEQILARPRYGGMWLNRGIDWDSREEARLRLLCEAKADPAKAADAIGRTPYALANRAREIGLVLPSAWATIIRPKRQFSAKTPLLCYPYVKQATPDAGDLLRANALVPRLPEWMRADICQAMMLALYEGNVTLDEIEANKSQVRWFIKKFYKEQMPWQEVQLGRDDDERSYEDIAAAVKSEAARAAQGELRATFDAYHTETAPTQIDQIYDQEIGAAKFALNQKDEIVERGEVIERMEAGEIMARDLNWKLFGEKDGVTIHARQQLFERFGVQVDDARRTAILRFCRDRKPEMLSYGKEIHRLPGNSRHGPVPFVYDRAANVVVTVLPSERR